MKYSISRLRRPLASFALALTILVGGAGSAAAASPAPSPTPKVTVAPRATTSPATTPGTKTAPTHRTLSKPATLNKTLAKVLATRNAATATLAGPSVCVTPGTTVSYDLYASAGVGSAGPLAGVNYWGFNTQPTGALLPGDPAATLYMCQADTLSVTLHDNLLPPPAGNPASNAISLEIPAANVQPDVAGTTTTKGYTFSGLAPGTYLYEAGPTPGGARQVGMGLADLLIVRPTGYGGNVNGSSAYGTALSQFTDEATLAVSELSTEFSDNPYGRDLHEYTPNLFLVNGQPFSVATPNTIPVAPGDRVLLHEANLGLRDHSLTVLGHRQSILADDSHLLTNALDGSTGTDITTKFLTPGQVADSFVSIDAKAQTGFTYPIFDAGFHFNNDNAGGLGGMLAQLSVATGVGGSPTGPATTNVNVTPTTNAGTSTTTVAANLSSAAGLSRAEWFVDNVGVSGSGCDGAANTSRCVPGVSGTSSAVSFTLTWADYFAALLHDNPLGGIDGDHVIWIHAQDANGLWGTAAGDVQSVAVSGPGTGSLDLHSSPTNPLLRANDIDGSNDLVVWSSAMSSLADWTVLGSYACVDSSACNTSPAGTAPAGAGLYNLYTDPPATGSAYDATYGVNGDQTVHPSYVDLPGVYYFTAGRPSACTPLPTPGPAAGLPDAVNEPGGGNVVSVCGVLPAAALQALTTGVHILYVHSYEGKNFDASPGTAAPAGWGVREGAASVQTFVIDRTGPVAKNLAVSPNPNNGFQNGPGNLGFLDSVRVSATLDDSGTAGGSAIANAEVFLVPTAVPAGSPAGTLTGCGSTTPPPSSATGSGAFMIPSSGSWSGPTHDAYAYVPLADIRSCLEGTVVLWVHGQDVAGNWGDFQSVTLTLDKTLPTVTTPLISTAAGVSTLTATADDPLSSGVRSGVVGAEWFTGADPGPGNGLPVISNPNPPPVFIAGNHVTFSFIPGAGHFAVTTVVSLRVIDGAGNWSTVKTVPVP